jgi:diguanylate cyclase (GGDEF)-like protein
VRILIAEDDAVSRHVLATTLTKWGHEVVITSTGLEAWAEIQKPDTPLLAILDWMMPGMDGLEVCRQVRQKITATPIYLILLTALSRKEDLIQGLEAGADDYLTKPFNRHELRVRLQAGARIVDLQRTLSERVRELEKAIIERKRAEDELRGLTLTDNLTGLYNHRGFFTLVEHHAKSTRRSGQSSLLIFADMDGLKHINDTFGHNEGSLAIVKTAEILKQTFRDSDIIARVGGDEFAILAPAVSSNELDNILERLRVNLMVHNERGDLGYQLSLSIGSVIIHPQNVLSIEELMALADRAMYANKRSKSANAGSVVARREVLTPKQLEASRRPDPLGRTR